MEKLVKATIIDGIAATEGRDSQGEILKLAGADISQMTTKGMWNDNHGSGFINTLGRITEAKKIFKREDCVTDRQLHFWKKVGEKPFLYAKGYLFDDEDHPNAKAVAAIMKGFQKMGTPMDVKMSVEGKVVDRAPGGIIAESMVRNVALTLIPANGETAAGIAGSTIQKCLEDVKRSGGNVEYADSLIKSMGSFQVANRWENRDEVEVLNLIDKFNEIRDLIKMLAPGYGSAGPANTRVGQAALTTSSIQAKKAKLKTIAKSLLEKNPGMTLEKAVGLAVSHMAGEDLEKRSKNVREKVRNASPAVQQKRLQQFGNKYGVNVVPDRDVAGSGQVQMGGTGKNANRVVAEDGGYNGITRRENTLHELGHAFSMPKGRTMKQHQRKMDNLNDDGQDEAVTLNLESKIARRAGVKPPDTRPHVRQKKGTIDDAAFHLNRQSVKNRVNQVVEGIDNHTRKFNPKTGRMGKSEKDEGS